jgi:hypothetical protein
LKEAASNHETEGFGQSEQWISQKLLKTHMGRSQRVRFLIWERIGEFGDRKVRLPKNFLAGCVLPTMLRFYVHYEGEPADFTYIGKCGKESKGTFAELAKQFVTAYSEKHSVVLQESCITFLSASKSVYTTYLLLARIPIKPQAVVSQVVNGGEDLFVSYNPTTEKLPEPPGEVVASAGVGDLEDGTSPLCVCF